MMKKKSDLKPFQKSLCVWPVWSHLDTETTHHIFKVDKSYTFHIVFAMTIVVSRLQINSKY